MRNIVRSITKYEPLKSFVGEDGTVTELVIDHLTKEERIELGIDDQAEEEQEEEIQNQEQEQQPNSTAAAASTSGPTTSQSQTNTTTHWLNSPSINMSGGQITINFSPPSQARSSHDPNPIRNWIDLDVCGLSSADFVYLWCIVLKLKYFQNKKGGGPWILLQI